ISDGPQLPEDIRYPEHEDDGGEQRQRDIDAQPKSKAPNYMRGWNSVGERYATS
ncbi:hypothetical protein LCGC14_3067230, partial [marine sediment metagenome]